MACSCRTTALRLFVKSFAQLQIADSATGATASSIQRQYRSVSAPRVTYRDLHFTALRRSEATPATTGVSSDTRTPGHQDAAQVASHQSVEAGGRAVSPEDSAAVADLTLESIDVIASEVKITGTVPLPDESEPAPATKLRRKNESTNKLQETGEPRLPRKVRRMLQFGPGDTLPQTDETPEERKKRRKQKDKVKDKSKDKTKDNDASVNVKTKKKRDKKSGQSLASEESEPPREKEPWMVQKEALEKKFGDEGWQPRKKLSPDALQGIRALHQQLPDVYTTAALAERFEISPDAIRRILRSKWTPSNAEEEERQQRWFKRGKRIWEQRADQGAKAPRRWRDEGVKTNWAVKREFVRRRMERHRRDEDGYDNFPSGGGSSHSHPRYRSRDGTRDATLPLQLRRRNGGPRRLGGDGGSGNRDS